MRSGDSVVSAEKDGTGWEGSAAEENCAGWFCFCGIQVETRNISEAASSPPPLPSIPTQGLQSLASVKGQRSLDASIFSFSCLHLLRQCLPR